jgi:hypothetical protein
MKRPYVGYTTCTVPSGEIGPIMLLVGLPNSHETVTLPQEEFLLPMETLKKDGVYRNKP